MTIDISIFSKWADVDQQIEDYCTEACYAKYFQGEIPKEFNKDEYLILNGDGTLISDTIKRAVKNNDIEEVPNDYENYIMTRNCVIYPKSVDLID